MAGTSFNVKVTAQDVSNNTATSSDASATTVTIPFTSPLPGATSAIPLALHDALPIYFTGGIANLTALGLTYTGNASAGTFTATSANGKTGSSGSVTTNPGALHQFAVTNTT